MARAESPIPSSSFAARPSLVGRKVAILVSDLFEQAELVEPKRAVEAAGGRAVIVSDRSGPLRGMNHDKPGDSFPVDLPLAKVNAEDFDALVLPGGVMNADALRMVPAAHELVRAIDELGKPIAVICHAPWLLVSAGLVKGRKLTSWPSLQDDIRNAGGSWVDQPLVKDRNWISSRKPADLPAFNAALIDELSLAHEAPAISVGP
jgi:protease I